MGGGGRGGGGSSCLPRPLKRSGNLIIVPVTLEKGRVSEARRGCLQLLLSYTKLVAAQLTPGESKLS